MLSTRLISLIVLLAVSIRAQGLLVRGSGGGGGTPSSVSRWPATEGSGTTVADSIGSNDLTLTTGRLASWVTGGLDYESTEGDWTDGGAIFGFDLSADDFTLCAAINPESLNTGANSNVIASKILNAGSFDGYTFELNNTGKVRFFASDGAGSWPPANGYLDIATTSSLSAATWYHICVSVAAPATAASTNIYINGAAAATSTASDTLSSAADTSADFEIATRNGTTSPLLQFDGIIGVVSVFNSALDSAGADAQCDTDAAFMTSQWSISLTCP